MQFSLAGDHPGQDGSGHSPSDPLNLGKATVGQKQDGNHQNKSTTKNRAKNQSERKNGKRKRFRSRKNRVASDKEQELPTASCERALRHRRRSQSSAASKTTREAELNGQKKNSNDLPSEDDPWDQVKAMRAPDIQQLVKDFEQHLKEKDLKECVMVYFAERYPLNDIDKMYQKCLEFVRVKRKLPKCMATIFNDRTNQFNLLETMVEIAGRTLLDQCLAK